MKKEKRLKIIAKSIGTGVFTVFLFLLFYAAVNKNTAPFMLIIREVFPLYEEGASAVFNLYSFEDEIPETFVTAIPKSNGDFSGEILPGDIEQIEIGAEVSGEEKSEAITELVGVTNVIYQPETDTTINNNNQTDILTQEDIEKLKDFDYLKSKLYTVDKRTELLKEDIDVEEFLNRDFTINESVQGPKVLIFHTHSQEGYMDSDKYNLDDGIFAVGERLEQLLETKYGIETLHDKSSYDMVDGKSATYGAYERMEGSVRNILNANPSIELVIDMHRDGVSDDIKFVTEVNGKPTAKIMFFNGLCRLYKNGVLEPTPGLSSNYVKDNLALSFNLQLLANELFPDFTRRVYINAYRYSLHFMPKSILVEVGAQTNTKQEALNAMEPLAELLAETLKTSEITSISAATKNYR